MQDMEKCCDVLQSDLTDGNGSLMGEGRGLTVLVSRVRLHCDTTSGKACNLEHSMSGDY